MLDAKVQGPDAKCSSYSIQGQLQLRLPSWLTTLTLPFKASIDAFLLHLPLPLPTSTRLTTPQTQTLT